MIKVSVIIPVFNMGIYLEKCLDSVMTQTLQEIEVICINDGSTDNSLEILQKYSLLYSNMIVLNQENCGAAQSRNNGLDIAQGEFVAFMDSDDFYPSNYVLECLYQEAKDNKVLICGGSLSRLIDGQIVEGIYGRHQNFTFNCNQLTSFRKYQFHGGFQRFIYQLEFLRNNELYFPLYSWFEDPPFFVKAMLRAEQFFVIAQNVYCYRYAYKKVQLTLSKTIDYAKGISDLLTLSSEHQLAKLHLTLVEALHEDLAPLIYRYASEGNKELQMLITQINGAIDLRLLQTESHKLNRVYLLEGIDAQRDAIEIGIKEQQFVANLKKYKEIIIYGAGKVGNAVAGYILSLDGVHVECFAVTDCKNNPDRINGLEVRSVHELIEFQESALILVATYSYLHQEIKDILSRLGFKHVLPINYQELQLFGARS